MRSMPPASSHFAERPVPAPPPIIGRPAASCARSRVRHSSRVYGMEGPLRRDGLLLVYEWHETNAGEGLIDQFAPLLDVAVQKLIAGGPDRDDQPAPFC